MNSITEFGLIFEPSYSFREDGQSNETQTLGYISTGGAPMPVFELGVFIDFDEDELIEVAVLMSAAPDMRETLKAALDFIVSEYASDEAAALQGDPISRDARTIRDKIVAALAKAEASS